MSYCNSCIDVMDDRYGDWFGCIRGELYGPCDSEWCGGLCEPAGRCDCPCHEVER